MKRRPVGALHAQVRPAPALRLGVPLLCLLPALLLAPRHAAGATCPPPVAATPTPDCKPAIFSVPGLPVRGGTITVHPGIPAPCVVRLPGGVILCAGGETAPGGGVAAQHNKHHIRGRAIFRISGEGPDGPGGLNIVVSASITDTPPNAPELLPQLAADALLRLPPNTVLVRLDAASGRFVPVPNAHLRLATLYKVLRRGVPPIPPTPTPPWPDTLPATGDSPFGAVLALAALLLLSGLWLGRRLLRTRLRGASQSGRMGARERWGVALCATGLLLLVAGGAAWAYMGTQPVPSGFGTLADSGAPPHLAGATQPPTRLVIARLGIDTPVLSLGIAAGTWQVPAYAAGYLSGGAWPGHAGNVAITGHDDRDGAVFQRLGELRTGDVVLVYAGARSYRYGVVAARSVAPTRTDLLRPTRGAVLTLITCTPYLIDTERLVVRARLLP